MTTQSASHLLLLRHAQFHSDPHDGVNLAYLAETRDEVLKCLIVVINFACA